MKEITYKGIDGSETYYEAEDGETFDTREDCIEYEEKEIPLLVAAWGYLANDTGICEYDDRYISFDIPDAVALNTVNAYLKDCDAELIDERYIGSRVLICDHDFGPMSVAGTYMEMLRRYRERLDELFGNFT